MQKTYYVNNEIDQDLYSFYEAKPFTIRAINYPTRTHTLTLSRTSTSYGKFQYSLDGFTWTNFESSNPNTTGAFVTFKEKIYLRAQPTEDFINNKPSFYFNDGEVFGGRYWTLGVNVNDRFALEGNIAYLIDYLGRIPTILSERVLGGFIGIGTADLHDPYDILDSVKNLVLPYTTLSNYCYYQMFMSDFGLGFGPERFANITKLPLMPKNLTLAKSCFKQMFSSCKKLKELPIINTSNFPEDCCAYMFDGCSSMTVSTTQASGVNNVFRLPYTGTATKESGAFRRMFGDTVPIVNTTYYTNCKVK